VTFFLVPGPDARAWCPKTMRHLLFHGQGGPTILAPPWRFPFFVGVTGRSPERPASSCGSQSMPPGKGPARPMLFARQALASRPRPKLSGKVKLYESPGRAGGLSKENYKLHPPPGPEGFFHLSKVPSGALRGMLCLRRPSRLLQVPQPVYRLANLPKKNKRIQPQRSQRLIEKQKTPPPLGA